MEIEREWEGGVRACPIVCGLSLETNYRFYSTLRSSGRSHCGVKSLAKAVSFCRMIELSLWQLPTGNMSTLWRMLAILKGYDDFLVDWAFTELPQSHHQMKAQHQGGKKIRTTCQTAFVIVCQCAKDIMSLLEESSCQNHNARAASGSASFGSILILC